MSKALHKHIRAVYKEPKNRLFSLVAALVLALLVGITVKFYWYQAHTEASQIIADDMDRLEAIFKSINDTSHIIDFEGDRNPINFLNVKSFVGSAVGSMNLAHPDMWQGPYLTSNPTVQNKLYDVVKTRSGYFIVPGNGVKLPSGQVFGKDITITPTTDVPALVKHLAVLTYNNKPLIRELSINQPVRIVTTLAEDLADAHEQD